MYKMCRDCSWRDQEDMRVREGDTVLMRFGEEVKSVKIRAVTNTTLFETDEGIVSPDSIEKWPWEFEQKGGDE